MRNRAYTKVTDSELQSHLKSELMEVYSYGQLAKSSELCRRKAFWIWLAVNAGDLDHVQFISTVTSEDRLLRQKDRCGVATIRSVS